MARSSVTAEAAVDAPAIDANGVDRTQIRRMLDLPPEERLRRIQEFVESLLEIRELNEERALR
jgi:hypothetical protein